MDTANMVMQAIGTLGFPIVACAALFWQNYKQDARHDEESKSFTVAINEMTGAIDKMSQALDRLERRIDDKGN